MFFLNRSKMVCVASLSFALALGINAFAKTETKTNYEKSVTQKEDSKSFGELTDKITISGQVRVRPEFRKDLMQAVPAVPGAQEEDLSVLLRTRIGFLFKPTRIMARMPPQDTIAGIHCSFI